MIRFACPGCAATFTVADEKAGKTGKCPKCQTQFVIPAAAGGEPPPADATPPADLPPPLPPPVVAEPPPPSAWQAPASPPPAPAADPVEIAPCPTCQARLSVLPSDLGLDVECPNCKAIYKAVRADAPPPPGGGKVASNTGLVKLGSGSRRDDDDDDDRGSRRKSSRRSRRDDDDDDDDDRPRRRRRRSSYDDYDRGGYREPHRGGMILAFAILGIVFCGIFAILAWVMGAQDLKSMDEGRMDPDGRGLTQAGKIIGMISCILAIVGIVLYCGFMGIMAGSGALR